VDEAVVEPAPRRVAAPSPALTAWVSAAFDAGGATEIDDRPAPTAVLETTGREELRKKSVRTRSSGPAAESPRARHDRCSRATPWTGGRFLWFVCSCASARAWFLLLRPPPRRPPWTSRRQDARAPTRTISAPCPSKPVRSIAVRTRPSRTAPGTRPCTSACPTARTAPSDGNGRSRFSTGRRSRTDARGPTPCWSRTIT
jgi:hypothetical protein